MRGTIAAGLLACLAACAATAAQAGQHDGHARSAPNIEGLWAVNAVIPLEATAKTPRLVVPEPEAKTIAAAIKAEWTGFFEMFLDPEAPVLIAHTEGLAVVRGQRRTRAVVQPADGRLPYSVAARKESETPPPPNPPMDNPESMGSAERCLVGSGQPPLSEFTFDDEMQIVVTRDQVALLTEYGDDVRIVPITDRHGPAALAGRMGDSIGRWEGKTLVIETIGMPDADRGRFFPTLIVPGAAKVIERLTAVSDNELLYQFTVVDPKTYTAPWLGEFSWFRTKQPIYESACHEGNYAIVNELAGARYEEAHAKPAGATKEATR